MAKPRARNHRIVRWLVQLIILAGFIATFLLTRYGLPAWPGTLLFHLDPLLLAVTSIAARVLVAGALWSLVFVAATVVFGRFFCGFLCPLGTVIDLFDAAARRPARPASGLRSGKYGLLLFLVVAALLGASFIGFFDPRVIFERTLTLVAYPVLGAWRSRLAHAAPVVFTETAIAAATFLLVLGLGWVARRFWCRNLCPLGGLYALLARPAVFRFRFTGECTSCGKCERVCPTGAIDYRERKLDAAECILCLRCRYECPAGTIRYRAGREPVKLDITRRQALVAVGSAVVAVPLARALVHTRLQGRIVRPPGAVPEPDFLAACLRCGRCMKACPTNGLQPVVFEAGVAGLWTPRLVPRIGGCEKNCNTCGRVCPTGAIRNLPLEEKTFARMGTAVVDKARCIAWEQDKHCLICDEVCPYDAIAARPVAGETALKPVVDERICVGCGLCEARCPIEGPAAIQVYSLQEERRRTGSYITPQKRELRECGQGKPEELPSGFILDDN